MWWVNFIAGIIIGAILSWFVIALIIVGTSKDDKGRE